MDFVSFSLSHHKDIGEVNQVLKVDLFKVNFPFVYHCCSLTVVMSHRLFNDTCVRLTDDSDDKVHEDHKQEEGNQDVYDEGEHYNESGVPVNVLVVTIITQMGVFVHDIETIFWIKNSKVTHGTPESCQRQSHHFRNSPISLVINRHQVVALCKDDDKYRK